MSDSQAKRTLPRMLISLLITLAIGAVWFYVSLPAINLHNTGFYSFVFILLLVYILVFMIILGVDTGHQEIHLKDYLSFAKNQCKIVVLIVVVMAAIFVVGQLISAPIFRAGSYHELLDVGTGDFATEIEPVSFDEIPMLDEASASVLGDRKLGELSDMVSQFDVSADYTQINYQGRPVRVAALEYGDFFKWFLNTKEGLPAYITVDTASLIVQQYDYYGTYVNGFINSLIGQKDVTVTTENFNYLAMDDDVYMYTGITSASSDQSNIGFLLSNQRTKETTYYPAPGAIESSAQRSAEGIVQDLGYTATFPLLLNIGGQPTYFMSLKDSSQLVKMYAMVNVSQYQIVAQGTTVAACESDYIAQLQQRNIPVTSDSAQDILEKTNVEGTIAEIRTAVLDGDSWYYVRLDGADTFYAMAASKDRNVVILNVGDAVSIQISPEDSGNAIVNALSISTGNAAPDPVKEEPDNATDAGGTEPTTPTEE